MIEVLSMVDARVCKTNAENDCTGNEINAGVGADRMGNVTTRGIGIEGGDLPNLPKIPKQKPMKTPDFKFSLPKSKPLKTNIPDFKFGFPSKKKRGFF